MRDGARPAGYAGQKGHWMLGTEIIDAALLPAMLFALLGGLVSFLSPCVLPIVPPYLAYMGGVSIAKMTDEAAARRRVIASAAFFVLGLSTVFLILGFIVSALAAFFLKNQDWFVVIAGGVVMVFGMHFLGIFRIAFMDNEMRMEAGDRGGSAFGAYMLGLAFAFGWTPCIGPVLGSILTLAASEASTARGTLLLGIYALGLGLPFMLVAAIFPRFKGVIASMRQHQGRIEKAMGLLLWTVGLMMLTGQYTDFSWWLLERFPALATLG